jgi:hypothetical protein
MFPSDLAEPQITEQRINVMFQIIRISLFRANGRAGRDPMVEPPLRELAELRFLKSGFHDRHHAGC